ncbi:Di-copper centre-containing protein [Patellaria atrata CBS 101060]|uniref:Di-copper centre-containing protein n=1 Tax=Patellaria atrata CBS 101060 TaxID=1346257 RepID=A0A9P4SEQ9_9PEZI|nr:Di-copper centre-containing protein [Patellaria atrata CBS 101060]
MGYNPRCLRRDINPYVSSRWNRDIDAVNLILQNPDIAAFQSRMQGDFPAGFAGVHTGGHFTIGGDPGGDLFASPGDPAFYLHHANIDRTWWTWQNMDIAKRTLALAGNTTLGGDRPTRLEDNMDIGVNAGEIKIKDAMNTIGGAPFCYIYV